MLLADHDYVREMIPRSLTHEKKTVLDYYKDSLEYGPAMQAFSEYVGKRGSELADLIDNPRSFPVQ